jgi:hypothetical protein
MAWDDHAHARHYLRIAIGTAILIAGVTLSITESTDTTSVTFYGLILIGIYNIGSGIYRIVDGNAAARAHEERSKPQRNPNDTSDWM